MIMNSGSSNAKSDPQRDFRQLNALLNEAPGDEASEEEVQAYFQKILTEEGGEEMLKRLAAAVQRGASLDPMVEERRGLASVYRKPHGDLRFAIKVVLVGFKPTIWRRLSLSSTCCFFDIHCAIQDALGWEDRYPHHFELRSPDGRVEASFGVGSREGASDDDFCGVSNQAIGPFSEGLETLHYCYQSPDQWQVLVTFEKIYQEAASAGVEAQEPFLIEGHGFGPPEDVGGLAGFQEFLKGEHPLSASHEEALLRDWPRIAITNDAITFRNPLAVLLGEDDD